MQRFQLLSTIVAFVLAGALSGCGGSSSEAKPVQATAPAVIPVSSVVAEAREVPVSVNVTGTFVAEESSDVAPELEGQVWQTPVDVGAMVKKGDILVRLNPRDAQIRLQQARAAEEQALAALRAAQARVGLIKPGASVNVENVPEVQAARAQHQSALAQAKLAEADAARYASLLKTGDVAETVYDQAKTRAETLREQANAARQQYEAAANAARQSVQAIEGAQAALSAARAQVALAEKALADTVIRSPFSGAVTARPVSAGEWVTKQTKVATVVRIQPIEAHLQVPEVEASRVRNGLRVTARVQAYPEREFNGAITAINAAIDPATRAFTVEAAFQNADSALRPGMFTTAGIQQQEGKQVVVVPASAVQADPNTDSHRLYIVEDGRARLRIVQLTRSQQGNHALVASGLRPGERVITNNLDKLFDGVQVDARSAAASKGQGD